MPLRPYVSVFRQDVDLVYDRPDTFRSALERLMPEVKAGRKRERGAHQDAPNSYPTHSYIFGRSTVSMTWITPFDCLTSAMVTVAALL